MSEEAHLAALEGRWDDAITINKQIVERSGRDASAYNRLGKAYIELGDVAQATEAYTGSLKADPANMIARRNLQRLELMRTHATEIQQREKRMTPRTNVFIQEVGKTWVDELLNTASIDILAEVASGEALDLKVEKGRMYVYRNDGVRLGEVDPRTAVRVIELIAGGNTYEVYALGTSASGLRVILRETYRHPSQADRVSFPRQISQAGKYLRERDVLRQRDEADFYFSDDDDEEVESDTEEVLTDVPDEDDPLQVDTAELVEEPVVEDDDEDEPSS